MYHFYTNICRKEYVRDPHLRTEELLKEELKVDTGTDRYSV